MHGARQKYRMEFLWMATGHGDGRRWPTESNIEQIWIHSENMFCSITKRKLENACKSKYL